MFGLNWIWMTIIRIVTLILCFPIHESAHAWVAYKLGDPTGKEKGRISLNPLKHMDVVGLLMMIFLGVGYAKPVPINLNRFKKPKLYCALSALAGPASNILLALLTYGIIKLLTIIPINMHVISDMLIAFLLYFATVNISLAVFNLIPIPPLDGSRLLMCALPDKVYVKFLKIEKYSMIILFVVLIGLGRLGISPVSFVTNLINSIIINIMF